MEISQTSLNREIFRNKNEENVLDSIKIDISYGSSNDQEEIVKNCSKKMKLFEEYEKKFLQASGQDDSVKENLEQNKHTVNLGEFSEIKNTVEIPQIDSDFIKKENSIEEDLEDYDDPLEVDDDDDDFCSSDHDYSYDGNFIDENGEEDENNESESEADPPNLVDNLLEVLRKLLAAEKEKEKEAKDKEAKVIAEEKLNEERINKIKLSASELAELDRTSRMKMISSILQSVKEEIFQNTEESKRQRKRKRSDSIDGATQALIKHITPLRRSSRNIERKNYSGGCSDPELVAIVQKLKNYGALNGVFNPSLDEACYNEDFRGFNLNEAKRNLYSNPKKHRRHVQHRTSMRAPVPALDVSEITDSILSKVVTQVSLKVYSQSGSTCHQCRQKTTDTKTFCRSGECTGVRGQFCGVCLLNRYGEDIVKALLDEKWSCPPCRDICNCSICRNRKGLPPTGILTPLALHKGYDSVTHYLQKEEEDL